MAKTPAKSGKPWTKADVQQLKQEIKQNTPTRVMALHLHRTPGALQKKANDLGLFHQADEPAVLRHEKEVGGGLAYGNPDGW